MSGVGEMIVSSVANRVAGRLADLVVEEGTLLWRFKDDVDDMKEKMRDLEAVMQDADDKARQRGKDGAAERRWLTKLKSVAYDIEDVLDEFDAAELIKKHQPKVKLFFSRNNLLLQKMTIAHNMKNLREKMVKIETDGKKLNLVLHEPLVDGSRGNETFAVDDVMDIGMLERDAETEKIISLLLNTKAKEDISIIPIVGLGGLGKTTLAQAVFADKRVNAFDMRIWVYVSKEFDLLKIGKAIIRGANKSINLDNCNLQFVQDNMRKELANRRYLIVLDDLWEDYGENLEKLKQMLQHGDKGSKIIVTTRSRSVVQVLHTGYLTNERKVCPVPQPDHINLGVLSPDTCWRVMKRRIFGPDDEQSGLEEIGRQIACKCGGLPLVANALGQVMSEHRTIEAWTNIRDRKIALDFKADHQRDTLERLMLSYYYMKREFKMCFTYLAAFSKGFIMDTDRLIQQWRALGYIEARASGERCIKYLLGMSFLQISKSLLVSPVHTKAPRKLIMHDLVHDLVTIIAAHEFLIMNATVPNTWNKANKKRYCRHTQLVNHKKQSKVFKDLPSKVRTIHFRECNVMQLPPKAFSEAKYIRILDLSCCSFEGQSTNSIVLPSSTRQLLLLAYLDVSGLSLASLPKFFHTLQNMQTLILSNCSLETLPANIGNLHKLCFLDLSGNSGLTKLPTSFKNLLSLSFLQLSGCANLKELPESIDNLKCLQQLDMSGCCALQKLPDKFGSLPKLSFVNLSSCSKLTKLPDCLNLDSLEHLNLSNCHELESLPEGIGNLYKLEVLDMSDCYRVQVLPETFCQLKHLKDLNLSDCHGLRQLPESFGDLSEIQSLNLTSCSKLRTLPHSLCKIHKLKHLNLSYCIMLEYLPSSFSNLQLQVLDLTDCYNLHDLPDRISKMTSLTELNIAAGSEYVFDKAQSIREHLNLPGTIEHDVHEIENVGSSSIVELGRLHCHELIVGQLPNLRHVTMEDMHYVRKIGKEFYGEEGNCKKLRVIWLVRMDNLEECWTTRSGEEDKEFLIPNLHYLQVIDCPKLSFLPYPPRSMNWKLDGSDQVLPERGFDSLVSSTLPFLVSIENCNFSPDRWGRLQHLATLENFYLQGCSGLRTLPDIIKCFLSLRRLDLRSLEDLEILPEWLGQLVSIDEINIIDCPNLTSLPKSIQNLTALRELWLQRCKGLEILPEGLGLLASLKKLLIMDCPKLTFLPESMMNLTGLEELWLGGFNSLPEWIGQLSCLKEINIFDSPNMMCLPESTQNLNNLKELYIWNCLRLIERCREEDANKISHISHIPRVILDGKRFIPGQAIEGPEV
uniref:Uncharacterized protein n=1 Tax=Oryza brachyantha TaxID=4533 RepID=J3L7N8_ORYBR